MYLVFGINTTHDISKLSQISLAEIKYNNFEISLVVFMPNITRNHAITYTNYTGKMNPTLTCKVVVSLKKPSYGFLKVLVAVAGNVVVAKTPF